jgi:hypothetical protein
MIGSTESVIHGAAEGYCLSVSVQCVSFLSAKTYLAFGKVGTHRTFSSLVFSNVVVAVSRTL